MSDTPCNPTQPDAQPPEPPDQRDRAQELLLFGLNVPEVARELGVSRSTVWRWTRSPDFAARYRVAAQKRVSEAAERLDDAAEGAVAVLSELAEAEEQPAAIRVRAASALLQHASFARREDPRAPPREMPEDFPLLLAARLAADDSTMLERLLAALATDPRARPMLAAALREGT
jgi:transposase